MFPFPDDQIDATNTNALAVLTVYPVPNAWTITDQDLKQLTDQCSRLNNQAKRRLLIRFGPEMNGFWTPLFPYQQQPSEFVALWRRVYTAIKASCPTTGMIWSPNFGTGCKIYSE
jgi:beta-mannanase